MRRGFKETIATGTAIALIAGCTSSEQGNPEPTRTGPSSAPSSPYPFISDGYKSDTYQVVNCVDDPSKVVRSTGINLANPLNDVVTQTVGVTETGDNSHKVDASYKALGGITVYALGQSTYEVATSDNDGQSVRLGFKGAASEDFIHTIELKDKPYRVIARVFLDQQFGPTVTLSCDSLPLSPTGSV